MAVRPILSNQAKNPLLDQYNAVQANNNKRKKFGERYTTVQKDIASYEFLSMGNSCYAFKKANIPTASRSTILRHIATETNNVQEGNST